MTIDEKRDGKGNLIGWKIRVCVGREGNKQKWKTATVKVDDEMFDKVSGNKQDKKRMDILNAYALDFELKEKEKFVAQKESGVSDYIDPRKITFTQYVNKYWWNDVISAGLRPSTVSFYEYTKTGICRYFDSLPKEQQKLKNLDARGAKDFINWLNTDAVNENGEPFSQTTKLRHWQTFRNIINSALRDDYLEKDPCLKLKITDKPSEPKYDGDYLTAEQAREFIRMLDHLDDGKPEGHKDDRLQWKCLFNILLQHGLRRGECVGLRYCDIKSETVNNEVFYTMTICNSVTPNPSADSKRHIDSPKTEDSARTIILEPKIYAMLEELKAKREKEYKVEIMSRPDLHMPLGSSDMYIFCKAGDPNTPMFPSAPTKWLSRFIEGTDLPEISPHDLRRTWATLATENGVPQKAIQINLGHSDGGDVELKHYVKSTIAQQINTLNVMHSVFYKEDKPTADQTKQA